MLLHILKRDLKRKRTMNVILLLFILLATMFLAASVNNLVTITGAVDSFLELAKAPDYLLVMLGSKEDEVEEFLRDCESVREYEATEMFSVTNEEIRILQCAKEPDKERYERRDMLAVGAVPENFMKVFDTEGKELSLQNGEIAIPVLQAEQNQLSPGDIIEVTCGNTTKQFTLKCLIKDAVFGMENVGFKRILITREDYDAITEGTAFYPVMLYAIAFSDKEAFHKAVRTQDFQLISSVDKDMIKMSYVFDMLIAGVLIIASICLILVSFLILRFTIVFTLQGDYKEIGIMKAIGIKSVWIRGIYMLKYLVLAIAGTSVGLLFSFPFEKLMLSQTMVNIVTVREEKSVMVNILCVLLILMTVLLFCYSSTGKVKKFTVMEAIRNGENGERYHAKTPIRLHKRKWLPACVYMAVNDVISSKKRYLILGIVFCIGIMEILLPLSAIHTLQDKEILRTMSVQPADFFIDTGAMEKYVVEKDQDLLLSDMKTMENKLSENGFSARVWSEIGYAIPIYGNNPEEKHTVYTLKQVGTDAMDYDLIEGSLPELANEVMITRQLANQMKVGIGDSVYYKCSDHEEEFVITGLYQSMINMGKGVRGGREAEFDNAYLSGIWSMQIALDGTFEEEEMKARLQELFPEYKIYTAREFADEMTGGGIIGQLNILKIFLTIMVLLINVLITILTMKTLITRERGEIAMLKSIGISRRTIKLWQSLRILFVLFLAILLGTALSKLLAPYTIGPVFSMMGGSDIKLVMSPLESFVLYPLLLMAVTGTAAYLCAKETDKVDLQEINTLE